MNNFGKRAISGFLFVVILTACIYIHPFCFFALFFIIKIIGLLEFSHMAEVIHIRVNRTMCILSGSLLFISGFIHNYFGYKEGYLFFFSATFFMGIWELYRKSTHAFQNMAFGIYALFYFTLPFTLLIYLPYLCTGRWQPDIIFFPFFLVWFNDTFAYLFGSKFGKHKLFPVFRLKNPGKEPSEADSRHWSADCLSLPISKVCLISIPPLSRPLSLYSVVSVIS